MGMAAALALAEVWSAVPVGAAAAAGGAAAASAVLRRPLATVLILLLFFPFGALLPLVVGAGVGALAVSLLGDRAPEPTGASGATDRDGQPVPPYTSSSMMPTCWTITLRAPGLPLRWISRSSTLLSSEDSTSRFSGFAITAMK